jgi:alkylation response protein AidB-like acyl-CoA dehydrogenase
MRISYTPEQEELRRELRSYFTKLMTPERREALSSTQGEVGTGNAYRDTVSQMGKDGWLTLNWPKEYGGQDRSPMDSLIFTDEAAIAGVPVPFLTINSVAPTIMAFGTEEQKKFFLPKIAAGELHFSIGYSEPGAGTDLANLRTTAVRDGDDYVINGQKVYISHGQLCDVIVLACKTDPAAGAKGMSFLLVEADRAGFKRGRNLKKIGLKAQDTSELFFDNVRVPASNLLGTEGGAFGMAMSKLAEERLTIAVSAITVVETVLKWTVAYTRDRKAFGQAIGDFQNTRFKLADLHAQALAMRVLVDRCIELLLRKELDAVDAASAKLLCTELQCKAVDDCLQFFGGYGYMLEYPIARAYIDARVRRIAGGSSEIMREIIGRQLFAGPK